MKKKFSLGFVITLMLIASALTCLILTFTIGRQLGILNSNYDAVREYAALLDKIEELYIGEYDNDEVSAAAMHAAVYALGDRWSFYMTPEEYAEYLDSSNNSYVGIGVGVVIDEATGGMRVRYTYRGASAEMAGILSGDIITAIDGESIIGLNLDEMRAMLARPVGDTMELDVLRAGGNVETLTVEYNIVFTDPVSFEMLDDFVGYICIANFERGAADSFIEAVEQLTEQGARAFVFDVRSNGGGRVNEMTRMLDYLLPEGDIFVSVGKNGKEDVTKSGPDMIDVPAAVITNRYSFSAAEYFAATLREYDYAEITGEQTTGKSRSQITITMPGGGALHLSTNQYLTKNRVSLFDAGGVTPDYPVSLTEEEFDMFMSGNLPKNADPQILKALELLK